MRASACDSREWDQITYTYDPQGRRIAKAYDAVVVVKYVYDGEEPGGEGVKGSVLGNKY